MRFLRISFAFSLFVATLPMATAADVESGVSTRETDVGLPITMTISVHNAVEHEQPQMPEVDGLEIEALGPPRRSRQISIVNGRRTERTTVTYSFRVTPVREGTFTIPPVKVTSDGFTTITKAVRIVASKSETDDLLFVEIEGKLSEIYVGQPLELTLKIFVRPFRSSKHRITLDEATMWRLISDQTSWGMFDEAIQELARQRQRLAGRQVLREDSEGDQREYLLYELEATVYPDRAGSIDGSDVRVIWNYPVELGRSRSPLSMFDDDFGDLLGGSSLLNEDFFSSFGSSLKISRSRPIIGEAQVDSIQVKPIPTQGRPADYQGAVGQYSIVAEARPTSVQVGDPITLQLGIRGDGPMDRVVAPSLASQRSLTSGFKVPDEQLPGFIDGSRKVFTTTIRPQHEDVTEIPPITFSFFDPVKEEFVSIKSEPIPVDVQKADVLALDAIVSDSRPRSRPTRPGVDEPSGASSGADSGGVSDGVLTGDLLVSVPRPRVVSHTQLAVILSPPCIVLLAFLLRCRASVSSLSSPLRRFRRSASSATTSAQLAKAMEDFLTRRYRLGDTSQQRSEGIGRLRVDGLQDLAIRVERLYSQCTRLENTSLGTQEFDALRRESVELAVQISGARVNRPGLAGRPHLSSTSIALALCLFLPSSPVHAVGDVMTASQRDAVLQQAMTAYRQAQHGDEEAFGLAAQNFQRLVDSGVRNDRLYYNLGMSYLGDHRSGHAVANFRRALALVPDSRLYHEQLRLASSRVVADHDASSLADMIGAVNDRALKLVPPAAMWLLFALAWIVFWTALFVRTLVPYRCRAVAALSLSVAVLAGFSYFFRVAEFTRANQAVFVTADVPIRQGDGEEFEEIARLATAEGRVVTVLQSRGDWYQVSFDPASSGWVPADTIEAI